MALTPCRMVERTAMFIDIEGFSTLYAPNTESDSLWGLSKLMEGAFRLADASAQLGISRLFVHHIGDGFVLVDDGGVTNSHRLVAAAVALHQFTLHRSRHFCKAAIDRGQLSDVVGCYPKVVTDARGPGGVIRVGDGLMTIIPVMGTAIINTHRLLKRVKGGVTVCPEAHAPAVEPGVRRTVAGDLAYIDWFASTSPTITTARKVLGIDHLSRVDFAADFDAAVIRNRTPAAWVEQTARYLSREAAP